MHEITKNRVRLLRALKRMMADPYNYGSIGNLGWLYNQLAHGEGLAHYVAISEDDPSQVSYARVPNHRFDSKRRVRITLPRYLRRQLGVSVDRFTDPYLSDVLVPAVMPGTCEVRLVQGVELQDAYANEVGNHSCMTGDQAHDGLLALYTMNPNRVQLALYYKNGRAIMRALWWKTDNGKQFLDRIYFNGEVNQDVRDFEQWAIRQGGLIRGTYSYSTGEYPNPDVYNLTVTLKSYPGIHGGYGWPYLDTFRYIRDLGCEVELGAICNYPDYRADSTDGYLERIFQCAECGEAIDSGDHYHNPNGDDICDSCDENYGSCDQCGEICPYDDLTGVQGGEWYYCESCLDRLATRCADCGEYFHNRSITTIDDHAYCRDCYPNNVTECHECNSDILIEGAIDINGGSYCSDCAEKEFFHCPKCGEYIPMAENITDTEERGEQWCADCVDLWRGREFFGTPVNALTGEEL